MKIKWKQFSIFLERFINYYPADDPLGSKHVAIIIKMISKNIIVNTSNKSNEMQQYADIYLLQNHSTCFGRPSRPSSGVHITVVAASGTDRTYCPKPVLVWSRFKKLAPHIVWSVPEAATTVLCTPDDGRDGRPKHME